MTTPTPTLTLPQRPRPAAGTPVLELQGVSKWFGSGETQVRAVTGANATLHAGQVVALLGPSGSGKSTLLLMAGLLEPPTEGVVRILGRQAHGPQADIPNLRDFRREYIGFVFQKPNLIPFLTSMENVRLAMEINDIPPAVMAQRSAELLAYLEVDHRADKLPRQLSGGEQQRVAIARALANHPPLVLADEPTAALDGKRGRQVVALFKRVAQDLGTAVLLVTHDHRSLDLVDRILEMEDGQLVERPLPHAQIHGNGAHTHAHAHQPHAPGVPVAPERRLTPTETP